MELEDGEVMFTFRRVSLMVYIYFYPLLTVLNFTVRGSLSYKRIQETLRLRI